ncbi:MAG TPA: ROK family protein, partial [Candidatus Limnocylindrales bacterium]|nr:ROK family protein [Candidatus Limnocylindrales bacterium]
IMKPAPSEPEKIVESVENAILEVCSENKIHLEQLASLGVCIAAFVDYQKGIVYESPNLGWHEPVPLQMLLQARLSCPVIIENDATAAVMGEVAYGAAQGHENVIYVTLSTGIGGGLFLNGQLYRGSNGFAGEIGHTKPFGKGRVCNCGGPDCLETWASGSAISRNAQLLWEKNALEKNHLSTAWVFDQAESGNTMAQEIIEHAVHNVSTGLANLVTLLNPTCLVIGGGVAGNRVEFFNKIRAKITEYVIQPPVTITKVEIVRAALEPEAGIWGMFAIMVNK